MFQSLLSWNRLEEYPVTTIPQDIVLKPAQPTPHLSTLPLKPTISNTLLQRIITSPALKHSKLSRSRLNRHQGKLYIQRCRRKISCRTSSRATLCSSKTSSPRDSTLMPLNKNLALLAARMRMPPRSLLLVLPPNELHLIL